MSSVTQPDLVAYLDEALPAAAMAAIEAELRRRPDLLQQLAALAARRDAGVHSVGEIWRRHRLSCPTREELHSYLFGALQAGHHGYIEFHLQTIGCRFCEANLADLQRTERENEAAAKNRRARLFQSTSGRLGNKG